MRVTQSAAALAALFVMTGCATAVRGTTEEVQIIAQPSDAVITTDVGLQCPQSPCRVTVKRKQEFMATANREGYKPGSVHIRTRVSGEGGTALAGNILLGGVIGVGVDAASGASLDHYPNPAIIVLEPIDPTNPATPPQVAPVVTAPPVS